MKRAELIEIAVLAVALITGYKFINSLYDLVIGALFQIINGSDYALKLVFQYFFIMVIYLSVFLILVRKSKWIAAYIDKQGQIIPELLDSSSDKIPISVNAQSLLYIIIVALAISTFLLQVPAFMMYVYDYFTGEVSPRVMRIDMTGDDAKKLSPFIALSKIALAALLLYFARPLAKWFASSPDLPVIETTASNES